MPGVGPLRRPGDCSRQLCLALGWPQPVRKTDGIRVIIRKRRSKGRPGRYNPFPVDEGRDGMVRNTAVAWGSIAKTFHWLIAGLILGQFVLGWLAEVWRLSPTKLDLFVWHKSFGMVILVLALLRLSWRLLNRPPSMPPGMPVWEQQAAHASHLTLYGLMIVMPLSGWIINAAANIPFSVFWVVPVPDLVAPSKSLQKTAEFVHLGLFWMFALAVGLHVSAALRHHFLLGDEVLVRMLPFARPKPSGPPS